MRPEGALLAVGDRGIPVEPVLRAGGAHEPLGELLHAALVPDLARVLALRRDVGSADGDGVELVPADAPIHDLFDAFGGVEPPVRAAPDEGDGEGPGVRADEQDRPVRGVLPEGPRLLGRLVEARPVLAGGRLVLREQAVGVLGPEERAQGARRRYS